MDTRMTVQLLEGSLVGALQGSRAAIVAAQVGNMEMAKRDLARVITELELAVGQVQLMVEGKHLLLPDVVQ